MKIEIETKFKVGDTLYRVRSEGLESWIEPIVLTEDDIDLIARGEKTPHLSPSFRTKKDALLYTIEKFEDIIRRAEYGKWLVLKELRYLKERHSNNLVVMNIPNAEKREERK